MMYQQLLDPNGNVTDAIKRLSDNLFISFEPTNPNYQAYLRWLEEGNEPLPADEPPAPAE